MGSMAYYLKNINDCKIQGQKSLQTRCFFLYLSDLLRGPVQSPASNGTERPKRVYIIESGEQELRGPEVAKVAC